MDHAHHRGPREHGHSHGAVDPAFASTGRGLWALEWSAGLSPTSRRASGTTASDRTLTTICPSMSTIEGATYPAEAVWSEREPVRPRRDGTSRSRIPSA